MKRIISALLTCIFLFTAMMPTAFAGSVDLSKYLKGGNSGNTLSIPDLADCDPDAITFAQEQSGIRVYLSDDVDALLDALVKYFTVLDSHFGLTGFDTDEESSDTFMYLYVSEYTGDADISPVYMDECPVPCYLLAAIGAQGNGSYLVAVMATDGIEFTADMPEVETASNSTTYTAPVLGAGGLLVMAPEEFNSNIPDVSSLGAEDNYYYYTYIDCGYESAYGDGNDEMWELFLDYKDALISSGYFELIDYHEGNHSKSYYLAYIGPENAKETFGIHTDGTNNAHIIVDSLLGTARVYFSVDIVVNNLEEVMEEKGFYVPDPSDPSDPSSPERNCAKCSGYRTVQCTNCWGTGQQDGSTSSGKVTCRTCRGRGSVTCDRCGGSGKER